MDRGSHTQRCSGPHPVNGEEQKGSVRFCMMLICLHCISTLVCEQQPAVMVLPSTITKSPVCEETLGYAMFIFFLSIKIFMISWLKIRKCSIMRFHRASDFCIKRFTTKYWKPWFETLGHSDYINGRWGKGGQFGLKVTHYDAALPKIWPAWWWLKELT